MKAMIRLLALCVLGPMPSYSQVAPAAVGPGQTPTAGSEKMIYAVRYSQSGQFYTKQQNIQMSNVSATLDYANRDKRYPFTAEYGGGYTWTLSGPGYQTGQFHRLLLTQGINFRRSKLMLRDNVSYLPQSPTIGFSGIPGTGEIIGLPNPTPSTSQTILTVNTHVVDNMAGGEFQHSISYATTLGLLGDYEVLRFPDGNGLDFTTVTGEARLDRRFSGRTTGVARASYTQYSYPGTTITIQTPTGLLGVEHRWTRNLRTNVYAGPQQVISSLDPFLPSSLGYSIQANTSYQRRFSDFYASYTHGASGGSGYMIGAINDGAIGNYTHEFGQSGLLGLTTGYNRVAALSQRNGVTNSEFGGAQVTWRIANNIIVFANYTAANQSTSVTLPGNTLNELMNTFGVGIGLSSREWRRPRQ